MAEQIKQAARTAGRTFNISLAELAGANAGQRNDLLALSQAVYRVPDGTLYTSDGAQLVPAQGLPVVANVNTLTGGIESLTAGGTPVFALGATIGQRDPMGRVTQFTTSGVAYSVVYGVFGIQTITGGGVTRTVSYNAQGQVSGVSNVAA